MIISPKEAVTLLRRMGVLAPAGVDDRFRVAKPPKKEDLATFVKAIKVLGTWSVATQSTPPRVLIECGFRGNELVFRVIP